MLEILVQLPSGTTDLKNTVVAHLGLLGQMSATPDIHAAWNDAKKKAAREYPDKDLSVANQKKLKELAASPSPLLGVITTRFVLHWG